MIEQREIREVRQQVKPKFRNLYVLQFWKLRVSMVSTDQLWTGEEALTIALKPPRKHVLLELEHCKRLSKFKDN